MWHIYSLGLYYLKKYDCLRFRKVCGRLREGKELRRLFLRTVRIVREKDKKNGKKKPVEGNAPGETPVEGEEWKEKLHRILTQKLAPPSFERLVQRVLRESGFIQVEVTGRTGDGGIDGRGIARIHGFMSFHVLFPVHRGIRALLAHPRSGIFAERWLVGPTKDSSLPQAH